MTKTAKRIRASREAARLSRQALNLFAFGVENATNITRLEDGTVRQPRASTLESIAFITNVSPTWLSTGLLGEDERITKVAGVGARIEAARVRTGMSARALSTVIGLGATAQNIRRLERGTHYPLISTIERIAGALDVSADKLAYGR